MYALYLILAIIVIFFARRRRRFALEPKKNSHLKILTTIREFYENNFLRYSSLNFKTLLRIKLIFFLGTLLLILAIKMTNISIYTSKIYTDFDYRNDLLFKETVKDKKIALEQEIFFLKQALTLYSKEEISTTSKNDIEFQIKGIAETSNMKLQQSADVLANKVYYRLHDYYKLREFPILAILLISLLTSFLPDVYLRIGKKIYNIRSQQELEFLKRIVVVYGSIKPVDFISLLNEMIKQSKYHRNMLSWIRDANFKNTIDNKEFYRNLISSETILSNKLFLEKLDQANNYDFEQAIVNIKNEFYFNRRSSVRKTKKRIEVIHFIGIAGFMVLICTYILYLIIPWLSMFNVNNLI
ncbi:MAG: hypothetical protein GX638_04500 [Crenarchaeota archaeon]|nr:hypothetical protein [Thermoproteota archaeon]